MSAAIATLCLNDQDADPDSLMLTRSPQYRKSYDGYDEEGKSTCV